MKTNLLSKRGRKKAAYICPKPLIRIHWGRTHGTTANEGTRGSLVRMTPDRRVSIRVFDSIWIDMNWNFLGKDYSGAKFIFIQISLNKAHSPNERHLVIKLCTCINNHSLFLRYLDWIFKITKCLSFRRVRHTTMSNRVPSTFVSISAQGKQHSGPLVCGSTEPTIFLLISS